MKCKGHENNENESRFKKLLIVKQILLVITTGNVERSVWRIWMLLLGCKGLSWENIFPGGGGEEGGTELLGTQKMGMYFQTGYGLQKSWV